ncbi:MAG: EthD domain-containing protein [Dehalococcoidia bacterium]
MVKLIYAITRKQELSVKEFQRYWRETHGPIAARIPGVRRYVQCHVLPELYTGDNAPAYDGAAELWFDDIDAMRSALTSPQMQAAREDEGNFIDHSHVFAIVTEENVVVE